MSTTLARALAAACAVIVLAGGLGRAETVSASLTPTPGNANRMVLDLAPPNGWAVEQLEDLIEIRFPGVAADITLPTAVRPPLADVSTEYRHGDTFLRFVVSCACAVAVSARNRSGLVLDFVRTNGAERTTPAPLYAPAPVAKRPVPPAGLEPAPGGGAGEIDVAEARERLMKQLLRAAEAGLIEIDPPAGGAEDEVDETDPEDRNPAVADTGAEDQAGDSAPGLLEEYPADADGQALWPADAAAPEPEAGEGTPGAVAEAAPGDVAAAEAKSSAPEAAGAPPPPPAECHPPEMFELTQPESGADWVAHLAGLRARLTGEFDRADPAAAYQLARAYIAGGFGAEAASVLDQFGDGGAGAALLTELAGLVDGRSPGEDASIWRTDCLGPQALWRALGAAIRGYAADAMAAEAASGRALERLPTPIRQDVAARLGLAAADAGAWETARRMNAMVRRSNADPAGRSGRALLLSARLARWADKPDVAIRALNRARASGPEVAAAATLMLADNMLRAGTSSRPGLSGLIADLGVLARLERGAETGARAAELEVMLTALADGRQAALDVLTRGLSNGTFDEAAFTGVLSRVAERTDAEDGDSVASIFLSDPDAFGPAMTDPRFLEILAGSLVELGLPDQAAALFEGGEVPGPLTAPLAEAYLATGNPRAAMEIIAEMPETDDRRRLQAAATAAAAAGWTPSLAERGPERVAAGNGLAPADPATASQDLARSLERTLDRLQTDGGAATAETAALLALALGEPAIPAAAAAVLKAEDPDRLASLSALFAGGGSAAPEDPEAMTSFLSRLDAEISVIEDMLTDG